MRPPDRLQPAPEISVVVPTFQRPLLLGKCLSSLRNQDLCRDRYEVIVVDDGSGPETTALLQSMAEGWPQLRWWRQDVNKGPAAARNRAVRNSEAPIVLFVDDDIVAPPSLVGTHLSLHEGGDAHLGVLGHVRWHPDIRLTAFMRWLDTTDLQFAFAMGIAPGEVDDPWRCFYTCNLSMRREMFLDVEGFDERFPYPAHEDTELALRLVERSFHLQYQPAAEAWNARPITQRDFCRRMEKVGEAAVILSEVRPGFPVYLAEDTARPPAWQRAAAGVLAPVAAALPSRRIRSRCYRLTVDSAYGRGVKAGLRRLSNPPGAANAQ